MQGFNMGRYIPPDALDAGMSANQASGKGHALGSRARKAHLGILTVRFEMPFAIWCNTCPESSNNRLVGQGVRFNAEKKRVGNYYSTPIWSFRMKHAACGGWFELRTDPKSSDFLVTEGAKKRDTGEDVGVGALLKAEDEREKKRNDAFAALEVKIDDRKQAQTAATRIEELRSLKERDWKDTYSASQKLRREFRIGRKIRAQDAEHTEALRDRMGLEIELVEESETDRKLASLVDFGAVDAGGLDDALASSQPLFGSAVRASERGATKGSLLQQQLAQNTRAAIDPFLVESEKKSAGRLRSSLRLTSKEATIRAGRTSTNESHSSLPAVEKRVLVDYDSD